MVRLPALLRWHIFLVLWLGLSAVARADSVAILLPDGKGHYGEFSTSFKAALRTLLPTQTVVTVDTPAAATAVGAKVMVAVGSPALQTLSGVARGKAEVLATLVPRVPFERALGSLAGASALYLDQPEERQMALVSVLPSRPESVGVIASSSATVSLPRLRQAAHRFKLKLVEFGVQNDKDMARAVQDAVMQAEVLLAHPDPVVFNPQSIQGVLLSSYRSRVPLLGFSPAYTRAGALASLHSSIPQMAAQAAELVRAAMQTGSLPGSQYPREFEISINRQVARSLGLDMPPEHVLVERVRQKERGQ